MTARPSQYVHGTTPDEQDRLSKLNQLLNQAALRELAISSGEKILDVGSGLGQLTIAMARAVGSTGRVLGIERSEEQIAVARRATGLRWVEFRNGDAFELPLQPPEREAFDLAHARFLLEHVPDRSELQAGIESFAPGAANPTQHSGMASFGPRQGSPEPEQQVLFRG